MKVYVDNMLVKSSKAKQHVEDLEKAFSVLRKYKMKLNPAKYAFGVTAKKIFKFMVSQRGIKVNPKKIDTILDIELQK